MNSILRTFLAAGTAAAAVAVATSTPAQVAPDAAGEILQGASPGASALSGLATTVETIDGPVRGVERGETVAYLGIPYAAPPICDLRWRPPQPPLKWSAPLEATAFSSTCAQNADLGVFAAAGGGEDCLYLNVVRSKAADVGMTKLPVLVWIHGSSLWVGAGSDYDAGKLAVDGNAIVVTINYRLGMFGFFAHPELDREGHPFANYGLMDQRAALDWVQANIERFGGDPTNVTIFGESSGGNSVLSHVVSPGSSGKFQHAIAMSGSAVALRFPAFGAPKPLHHAEEMGRPSEPRSDARTRAPNACGRFPSRRSSTPRRPT